ncbi:hypothetical protein ABE504_23960 [Paenibacillus oryzisoli]|uniref:hypothetical protein n=1 Tax=Paenibacillus oryzisoli TaxID=1850517 RepID=UPI003D2D3341
MSRSGKGCEVKKSRVGCKEICCPKKRGKRKHCKVVKKNCRKTVKVICKQQKAPEVFVTTPPPTVNVQTNPPDVHVTTPPPVVNVETPAPDVHVKVEAPDVHVKVEAPKAEVKVEVDLPDDDCVEELREMLKEYRGNEVELFTSSGEGSGGSPPNRIGIVERVGETTLILRPTTGNAEGQVAIYSICHIIGFRPFVPVEPVL